MIIIIIIIITIIIIIIIIIIIVVVVVIIIIIIINALFQGKDKKTSIEKLKLNCFSRLNHLLTFAGTCFSLQSFQACSS